MTVTASDRAATWVIIAAYEEARSIGGVVQQLIADHWRVLVVDDGSDDATADAAQVAGAWVVRHDVNLGQGAALATGFAFAAADRSTRFVVTFDADGQHDAAAIPRMIAPLASGEFDVTLGSRFLDGEGFTGMPATRKALLRLATRLARLTTGLDLTDTHNGMRAFRGEVLERMIHRQDRMAHASEIQAEIARLGLRYREVAVRVTYTDYSLSKGQRLIDAVSILWDLLAAKAR